MKKKIIYTPEKATMSCVCVYAKYIQSHPFLLFSLKDYKLNIIFSHIHTHTRYKLFFIYSFNTDEHTHTHTHTLHNMWLFYVFITHKGMFLQDNNIVYVVIFGWLPSHTDTHMNVEKKWETFHVGAICTYTHTHTNDVKFA